MAQNPSLKNAAVAAGLEQVLHYLEKDPETNIPKIMKLIDTVTPKDWYVKQRAGFRQAIEEKKILDDELTEQILNAAKEFKEKR